MKKIGIIGCGVIGSAVAEFVQKRLRTRARIVALCDKDERKARLLSKALKPPPVICDIDALIESCDLVIEAASINISGEIAEKVIHRKKDVIIMSTGGLLNKVSLFKKARQEGGNIFVPSGALCGLDGLVSAKIGNIKKVTLTTRKPIKGLKTAPYLKNKDIEKIKGEKILFKGSADKAVKYFPQNINVAATLSLMGIGPRKTRVKIITSPRYRRNIHELEVEGEFGRLYAKTENLPSKRNPKTSQLAVYSALAKVEGLV